MKSLLCCATAALGVSAAVLPQAAAAADSLPSPPLEPSPPRLFWAIAHRVLDCNGVRAAIQHGATAIEADMTPRRDSVGWWASHDPLLSANGDTAQQLFRCIVQSNKELAPDGGIRFVWLDIKSPDYCSRHEEKDEYCSVQRLRDLARQTLLPANVRLLYGFSILAVPESDALRTVTDGLGPNEAINIDTQGTDDVRGALEAFRGLQARKAMTPQQLVYSDGYFNGRVFWDPLKWQKKLALLKQAFPSRGKTHGLQFSWTINASQKEIVDTTGPYVDGFIYGFQMTHYYDHEDTRNAFQNIKSFVQRNPDKFRWPGKGDYPWGQNV